MVTPRRNIRNSSLPHRTIESVIERCRVYVDGHRLPEEFTYAAALAEVRNRNNSFVWLGMLEPSEEHMNNVAEAFGLHELIVEDAVSAHQRPKVERYDDQVFFVVRSVKYQEHESVSDAKEIISTGEVQMIVGKDFIITIRHGEHTKIAGLRQKVEQDPEQCALGPSAVAWRIADILVDEYLSISTQLGYDVDELESEVFTPNSRFDIEQIYMIKREILEMRHAIDPLAQALQALIQNHKDLLPKPIRSYFRDVLDHELIVADRVAGYDERLSALIDAGVAKITLQQNSDMRKISALVGMAALPTMIAGIYGMNFNYMPELQWKYAYFVVLGIMVGSVLIMWWSLRKNNWL
ncbi:magnesium/cobalt transporter CorA [Corynebacterium freiburgense]|uniref:magnesium/cobalt transporter CorA n=1 Tax=Corynebacterium freiburgense TaxID=556548 RepID=UPI0006852984|nr:magnesium/cobalt transporter CorA [Corynebacterium freiburgense]WJZ02300.1 Magnesium transport protein CorA [Corynebacterium freiburgense]